MTKLSTKELFEKVEEILEAADTNLNSVLQEDDCSDYHEAKKIGEFDYEFVRYGSSEGVDLEYGDGQSVEWVFKLDGRLFSAVGYYSSWDSSEITEEPVEVELATKQVQYYKPIAA